MPGPITDVRFTVSQLRRYPVKSMAGERLERLDLDAARPRGDRLWALRDVERDTIVSARRVPAALGLRARFAVEPDAGSGPGRVPPVVITLPSGSEIGSDDPGVHAEISAALDRDVRLEALGVGRHVHRLSWRERVRSFSPGGIRRDFGMAADEPLPDASRLDLRRIATIARYATPPGSFVDLSPVHLITEASLRTVGATLGDAPLDPRRFRANVVLAGDAVDGPEGLPEHTWTASTVRLGAEARLLVTMPTVRCVVPSREHAADLPVDRRITRAVAVAAERYLGAYADITAAGPVALGDLAEVRPPPAPGTVRRRVAATRGAVIRAVARSTDGFGRRGSGS